MDNDRQLRAEVRHALEAVTPPAPWLAARVVEGLRKREGGVGMEVNAASRRALSLAAVAVAALIVAALVVVLLASRALVPSSSVPAGVRDQATAQYVALVEADDRQVSNVMGPPVCQGYYTGPGTGYESPACRERTQNLDTAVRKFQADLERAHPPARLAGKHAQLRADLARLESVFRETMNDIDAKDYAAADAQTPELRAAFDSYNSDINGILSTPR